MPEQPRRALRATWVWLPSMRGAPRSSATYDYAVRAYQKEVALRLRYLERIPLGTPYTEVVDRVAEVTRDRQLSGRCHLAVDGTGVGRPVVDQLRRAKPEAILMPVTITGGQTETMDQGFYRVPKRDLIIGLQLVLQRGG